AGDEFFQRGFSRAIAPENRYMFTRINFKRNFLQNLALIVGVKKTDVVKFDSALQNLTTDSAAAFWPLNRFLHDLIKRLQRRCSLMILHQQSSGLPDRPHDA